MEQAKDIDFLAALRRRWALVLLITVLGAVVGYGVSSQLPPVYEGKASLLVGDFNNGDVSNNEIEAMQSLAATYADIGRRAPVLSTAAREVGMPTGWRSLGKSVHIRVPNESPQVIEITVEASSASYARNVAGAVADSLIAYVDRTSGDPDFVSPQLRELETLIEQGQRKTDALLARQKALGDSAPNSLEAQIRRIQDQVSAWRGNYASFKQLAASSSHVAVRELDPASADPDPVSPNNRFNTVMAGFAGFLLGLAAVYLLEARNARRRPPQAVAEPAPAEGGSPLILPPGLARVTGIPNGNANGTANGVANGRDVRTATSGRGAEHHEGETR